MNNNFTLDEKKKIAKMIKNHSLSEIDKEMDKLIEIGENAYKMSPRSRIGNNVVDYFTFVERLNTKGKYNANFYDFVANLDEFKKKKFIQNMLKYYDDVKNKNKTKNEYIVMKEVYNICISAINIMRPLVCMEMYAKYKPKCVLNFCAGWGGSLIAASALNIEKYIGIEINNNLKEPYNELCSYLKLKAPKTEITMIFDNALNVDYSKLEYDLVFTSPPYYFIEKYQNNSVYSSKKQMDELFYKPIFKKVYENLQSNGHFIINVCKEVYENVLVSLFGEANEIVSYKKSKRQNDYSENIYTWKKIQ
jgi:16S rRNA G966 N2-methylase RsmD